METASPNDCKTSRRPFILGVNRDTRRAVLFQPRCKMWSCPYCALVNRGLWAIRGFHGAEILAEHGASIDFLTLTSHERLNKNGSIYVFPKAWKKLRQRAARETGHFDYLLIPEQHQDGRMHIHAIETAHLGQEWWITNARQCGMGWKDEETPVRTPAGAAFYVVKYLTKSIDVLTWPKGFRRVRASRDWPKLPDMPPIPGWTWEVLARRDSIDESLAKYEQAGFEIQMLGSGEAWRFVSGQVD